MFGIAFIFIFLIILLAVGYGSIWLVLFFDKIINEFTDIKLLEAFGFGIIILWSIVRLISLLKNEKSEIRKTREEKTQDEITDILIFLIGAVFMLSSLTFYS